MLGPFVKACLNDPVEVAPYGIGAQISFRTDSALSLLAGDSVTYQITKGEAESLAKKLLAIADGRDSDGPF